MSSHHQCLVAEFSSVEDADVGCKVLESADFDNETVSIVTRSNDQEVKDVAKLKDETAASPPGEESIGVGGTVGGSIGAALGTATLIGPFMVAGPLVGMAVGAGAAGALAATDGWGVTKDKTEAYEDRVENGSVLIIVSDSDTRLDEAERLLKTTGPKSMERFNGA